MNNEKDALEMQQKEFLKLAVIEQRTYAQIEEELGVSRKKFTQWWEDLKEDREMMSKVRKIWKRKNIETDFEGFFNWYKTTKKECFYCKITEEQIDNLMKKNAIFTKRLTTRGRSLEIDRKSCNENYNNYDNLVFCCYWCNNAKTDEFSAVEFKKIAPIISQIWQDRLKF